MPNDTFLAHYGILGMRWGIRRTPEQLGSKPKTPLEEARGMSDSELKAKVARLKMEREYADLMAKQNQKKTSKARQIIGEILAAGAKSIAKESFDAMAKNMFKKAEAKAPDVRTNVKPKDYSSLSDKDLKAIKDRLETIAKIQDYMKATTVDSKGKKKK